MNIFAFCVSFWEGNPFFFSNTMHYELHSVLDPDRPSPYCCPYYTMPLHHFPHRPAPGLGLLTVQLWRRRSCRHTQCHTEATRRAKFMRLQLSPKSSKAQHSTAHSTIQFKPENQPEPENRASATSTAIATKRTKMWLPFRFPLWHRIIAHGAGAAMATTQQ